MRPQVGGSRREVQWVGKRLEVSDCVARITRLSGSTVFALGLLSDIFPRPAGIHYSPLVKWTGIQVLLTVQP